MAATGRQIPDKTQIVAIIRKLKSNSSNEVFNALKEIRSNVIKTSSGIRLFHQCGGLKSLVMFLQKPNEKNLNISLSILGNCCLDFEFRKEVGDFNISSEIISILRKIEKDSVSGRACRVLGNLAQDYTVARQLHENGAVDALLATIPVSGGGTASTSTRQMAVRALGALWCVPDFRRDMLRKNAVRTVAIMLVTESESQILQQILKVLSAFTKAPSHECASQVNGDGSGFHHLVTCISNKALKEYALTCICNLCNVPSTRPLLGNAGAVDILVNEVQLHRSKPLVHALCQLSHESVNRAKIREAGGLQILLTEARTQGRCLKSLEHYVYDEPSLILLLKAGLLPLLTELLSECRPPEPTSSCQKQKKEESQPKMKSPRRTVSSPDSAVYSMSPTTSPYTSPQSCGSCSPSYSYHLGSPGISDSCWEYSQSDSEENYSPVCSGDETDEDMMEGEIKKQTKEKEVKVQMDAESILILLARISHMETSIVNMAAPKTLKALLDYLTLDTNPESRAGRILGRLCGNPLNFIHVLLSNFIPLVHHQLVTGGVHVGLGNALLSQLSILAESHFGEGEIIHYLITSHQTQKETICIALPHLIRAPRLLKKIVLDHNGLTILLELIEKTWNQDLEEEHNCNILQFSCTSINILANSLDMNLAPVVSSSCSSSEEIRLLTSENLVSFELDDGAQVVACKSLLCQKSPFFEAMFTGQFSEAQQTSVKLPEISKDCLLFVISLMRTDSLSPEMDLVQALDLWKALDRFLIPVNPSLTQFILNSLSIDSAKLIYEQVLVSGSAPATISLKENTLKFILITALDPKVRAHTFSQFRLLFGTEFLESIEYLLKTHITTKYDIIYKLRCKNKTFLKNINKPIF